MDTTYTLASEETDPLRARAMQVGAVGLAACLLGFFVAPGHFYRAWLIAYLLYLSIALGSMALMMIQHLSGGSWGVFRRVFEASAGTLPLLAVMFLPVVVGMGTLYPWAHADHVQADEILRHKAPYLNTGFFLTRAVVYFAGWILLARTLTRWSQRQDEGDAGVNQPLQKLSGAGLVLYALTVTLAGVDWIMSINPHWYSTLFGFLMIGGQGLAALTFTIVVSTFVLRESAFRDVLKPSHFHDLGKLSLAFVMLWAYFNFSQFMLTYAANLVEEIPYYVTRMRHGWQYLALFLVVFHFAVPFALLLSRDRKRAARRLVIVALWILFVRYVDLFMLVSPDFDASGANLHLLEGEHESHFFVHWLDVAALVGIGGIWVWTFLAQLARRPLLAAGDPYLREALETTGGH